MIILQQEDDAQGSFYVEKEGERLAEMTYYYSHNKMVIDHTEVDEQLRGQSVGEQLVERGVEFAREKQIKIVPTCPYVKAVFQKHNKYDDVWR